MVLVNMEGNNMSSYDSLENGQTFVLLESRVRSYSRKFPCRLDTARGVELIDNKGRKYLDFLAGA